MINKLIRKWQLKKALEFFEKNQNTGISYTIHIKGTGKINKNVLISGTIHGDEPVGARFNKYLFKQIKKGKIVFEGKNLYLMLTNPEAAKIDKRFVDFDLNRSFDESIIQKENLYEARRAKQIMEFFKDKNIDYVIDLHSVSIGDTKLYVINAKDKDLLETIKKISELDFYFIYHRKHVFGIMIGFFESLGAKAVAIECGNHYQNKAIKTAKKEVLNLLNKFNLITSKKIPKTKHPDKIKIYETVAYIKPDDEFVWKIENVKSESKIEKNQTIAKDKSKTHVSIDDNLYLIMPTPDSKVNKTFFDAGFVCKRIE